MLQEFKKFIARGNVLDMAVGFSVGAAFTAVVKSLVSDVIMPPIGLLLGSVDFSNLFAVLKTGAEVLGPYKTLGDAEAAGAVTLRYGLFLSSVVSFLIVSFVVFLLVKGASRLMQKPAPPPGPPTTKSCPYCYTVIAVEASRCPNCTSHLREVTGE